MQLISVDLEFSLERGISNTDECLHQNKFMTSQGGCLKRGLMAATDILDPI